MTEHGVALGRTRDYEKALQHCEAALQADPALHLAQRTRATVLASLRFRDRSVEAYRAALQQKPDCVDCTVLLAGVLLEEGNVRRHGDPRRDGAGHPDNDRVATVRDERSRGVRRVGGKKGEGANVDEVRAPRRDERGARHLEGDVVYARWVLRRAQLGIEEAVHQRPPRVVHGDGIADRHRVDRELDSGVERGQAGTMSETRS